MALNLSQSPVLFSSHRWFSLILPSHCPIRMICIESVKPFSLHLILASPVWPLSLPYALTFSQLLRDHANQHLTPERCTSCFACFSVTIFNGQSHSLAIHFFRFRSLLFLVGPCWHRNRTFIAPVFCHARNILHDYTQNGFAYVLTTSLSFTQPQTISLIVSVFSLPASP